MNIDCVSNMRGQRGPRHFVSGTIRSNEYDAAFAATAAEAERIADDFHERGLHSVHINAPADVDDLIPQVRQLGRECNELRSQHMDAVQRLRAACLRLAERGVSHRVIVEKAGVLPSTLKGWIEYEAKEAKARC